MSRTTFLRLPTLVASLLTLLFATAAVADVTADRPSPYPNYRVGDLASLTVTTSPAQPNQTVYRFRTKNGEPDGDQPTAIGTTDSFGVFQVDDVELPPESVGEYSGERFAVGDPNGPRSNSLAYEIHASNAPSASRPSPFPNYEVGDTATLNLSTSPAQPGQPVYRFRYKNGQPDGVQGTLLGQTNSQGTFTAEATLGVENIGHYTSERFAIGTLGGPKSTALSYYVHADRAPTAFRPSPFPSYQVGDTAVLQLSTSPAQADQPVYRFRYKNGLPDGDQPTLLGATESDGTFHVSLVLGSSAIGSYSGERFAVGTATGPKSSAMAYEVTDTGGPAPPSAVRAAPYPSYLVGDTAQLTVSTDPVQAHAPVYRFRLKDGQPDGDQPTYLGNTNSSGVLVRSSVLDSSSIGNYTDERFAVGSETGPTSAPLAYTVSSGTTFTVTANRPAPYPDYEVGDTASLSITTQPAAANQVVYRYRLKNGQPDGDQPTPIGSTNSLGRFDNSAVLTDAAIGVYSGERFAIGDPNGPTSSALAYEVRQATAAIEPPIVLRPAPFPNYRVGDTAVLSLSTSPIQPFETVYRFRLRNGAPDGSQPTPIGTTDADGRFDNSVVLPTGSEGTYTEERFSVGNPAGPTSTPLDYIVLPEDEPLQAPTAIRPSPYPNYLVGQTASLTITTNPIQPNQPVYRYRLKDGEPDGAQPTPIGQTNAFGRFEVSATLPVEAIGNYTEEQFTVGDPDGLRSAALAYTVSESAPTGEVIFEDVQPNTIDTGQVTLLTLTGENFTPTSTVRVVDDSSTVISGEKGFASDFASSVPTVTVVAVSADGTSMQVEIDTRTTSGADRFELLAVDNGLAEKAQPIRLQGPGPVIDAWTPTVPQRGNTYVFTLLGNHLANVTIDPPAGVGVEIFSRANSRVMGLMTVGASVPTGPVVFAVTGNGQTVNVPMYIEATANKNVAETNLLAGSDVEKMAFEAGKPAPELLMQSFELDPKLNTAFESLEAKARDFGICIGFSGTWRFYYPIFLQVITLNLDTGEIGQIASTLGLGESLSLGAFTFSLTLDAAIHLDWGWCNNTGWQPLRICIEILVRAEVPGGNATASYRSCVSIGGGSGPSAGSTTQLDFSGGDCADVVNGSIEQGQGSSTVTQNACCPQRLGLQGAGYTFGVPFEFEIPDVGETTTDDPECCQPQNADRTSAFGPQTCPAASLAIREVSFQNDHAIRKDMPGSANTISDPVWTDTNGDGTPEKQEPAAYTRNRQVEIKAKFAITQPPSAPVTNATIKGTASNGLTFEKTGLSISGSEIEVTLTSSGNLPNQTEHIDDMVIDWEYAEDGAAFAPAGQSTHDIYVTLADPRPNTNTFLSALHLGIGAGGATTEAQAVTTTWNEFSSRTLQTWDNRTLFYYEPMVGFRGCALTSEDLLTGSGSGQCGSFARLLMDTLGINGISSTYIDVSSIDGTAFLVKNWAYGAETWPGNPAFKWLLELSLESSVPEVWGMVPPKPGGIYGAMRSTTGIGGQNTPTPSEKAFGNHYIVHVPVATGSKYFDPSYGVRHFNEAGFHSNAVAGYFGRNSTFPPGSYAVRKPGSPNIKFVVRP